MAVWIWGEVEEESVLWDGLNALPRSGNTQDIHCVTRWSRFDTSFEGIHWRELAKLCRPLPSARFAIAWAEHDFTTNVPLISIEDELALLATHADGEPLALEHGYPLRLVIPHKYFWKSAKWLRESSSSPPIARGSGSATATTTTPIPGRSSATCSNRQRRPSMAVAFVQEWPIQDRETTNYDEVTRRLAVGDDPPAGLLIHTAGFDDEAGVFRIFESWETEEQGPAFLDERVMPVVLELLTGDRAGPPPSREAFYELHHVVTG